MTRRSPLRRPADSVATHIHHGPSSHRARDGAFNRMLVSSAPLNPSFFHSPGVSSFPRGISTLLDPNVVRKHRILLRAVTK